MYFKQINLHRLYSTLNQFNVSFFSKALLFILKSTTNIKPSCYCLQTVSIWTRFKSSCIFFWCTGDSVVYKNVLFRKSFRNARLCGFKKNQSYRLHGWYQKKKPWVLFIFQVVKGGEECIVKFKIPKTFNILKIKHFKQSTIKKEIKYTIYQLYSYKQ